MNWRLELCMEIILMIGVEWFFFSLKLFIKTTVCNSLIYHMSQACNIFWYLSLFTFVLFFPSYFLFLPFFFQPAAAIAQSVERLTGEREVAGLIPGTGPILLVYNNWEMKALPLPCKWLDLHVARMTTLTGGPVSSKRRKNSVPS